MPVDGKLDFKKVAKVFNEKSVEMIPVNDINQITGYIRGGCSPLGMKKQFPTAIHITALEQDSIMINGGKLGTNIELDPNDLVKVIQTKVENLVDI